MRYLKPVAFIFCLCSFLTANAQLSNGLIAHWKFNGNTWDSSGNGHHAIPKAPVYYGQGKDGDFHSAVILNGLGSNYLTVPHHSQMDVTRFSFSAILKFSPFVVGTGSICPSQTIVAKQSGYATGGGPSQNGGYKFGSGPWHIDSLCQYPDTNNLVFDAMVIENAPYMVDYSYSPTISSGTWYCVTVTYDSLEYKFYVDGVLRNTATGRSGDPLTFNTNPLVIGVTPPTLYPNPHAPVYFFKGLLDDLKFYNRVLSDSEVFSLCNDTATSVDEIETNGSIQIYPNPGTGEFKVYGNGIGTNAAVEVCSLLGQLVYRCIVVPKDGKLEKQIILDEETPNGTYFLHLKTNTGNLVSKIILQR